MAQNVKVGFRVIFTLNSHFTLKIAIFSHVFWVGCLMSGSLVMNSPVEYKNLLGSGFLIFSFFRIFGPFYSEKNHDFLNFLDKLAQKSEKKQKIKNPLPSNFLYSPGLLIAKKLEFMDQTSKTS